MAIHIVVTPGWPLWNVRRRSPLGSPWAKFPARRIQLSSSGVMNSVIPTRRAPIARTNRAASSARPENECPRRGRPLYLLGEQSPHVASASVPYGTIAFVRSLVGRHESGRDMMPTLGAPELIIILVIIILIFGVGKLPEVGQALGKGIREFRGAADGAEDEEEPRPHPRGQPRRLRPRSTRRARRRPSRLRADRSPPLRPRPLHLLRLSRRPAAPAAPAAAPRRPPTPSSRATRPTPSPRSTASRSRSCWPPTAGASATGSFTRATRSWSRRSTPSAA